MHWQYGNPLKEANPALWVGPPHGGVHRLKPCTTHQENQEVILHGIALFIFGHMAWVHKED